MKINDILSREEIQALLEPSDLRGFQAVFTTWGMIAGSFAAVAIWPSWLTVLGALVILGGRHLALAILMHDASHYSLFRTRALNDWIGAWLCGYPTWQDLKRYRKHHQKHHTFAGSEKDPDQSLVRAFPVTRASLLRKFSRDIVGITGLKNVSGLLLMAFEKVGYTVAAELTPTPHPERSTLDTLRVGLKNMSGLLITNGLLFGILLATGHPELYLLWVAAYLTTFSLFVRIRSISEHACTELNLDPFRSTRSTEASWLARVTVAPHRVNYHLEHHLLMTMPYFNLPKLHRILRERGALDQAFTARNYPDVLRQTTRVR